MKKVLLAFSLLLGCAVGFQGQANAALLAELNFNFNLSISGFTGNSASPFFRYNGEGDVMGNPDLFEELILTPADVGSSFTRLPGGVDPNFALVAGQLTDGVNQDLFLGTVLDLSGLPPLTTSTNNFETSWFGGNPNSLNGIDFAGYTIDSIVLNVNSLSFPGTGGASGSYNFQINGTLNPTSPSAIPEPATLFLVGSGMLGLVYRRKKSN